jgi:broad specificity phosphatase PhoE
LSRSDHRLVLLRHGETEWSASGRHTSVTDLPLTQEGRAQAQLAALALAHLSLSDPVVFSSPRRRALDTATLAGLTVDHTAEQLSEWWYGQYEGVTTHAIHVDRPDWLLWTDGSLGGESVEDITKRADLAVALALEHLATRDVIFVGHGHFSRAVVTRWLEQPLSEGARYGFGPASLAVCGYEHGIRHLMALGLTAHREALR